MLRSWAQGPVWGGCSVDVQIEVSRKSRHLGRKGKDMQRFYISWKAGVGAEAQSVCLALQVWQPKFHPWNPCKKTDAVMPDCNPHTLRWDRRWRRKAIPGAHERGIRKAEVETRDTRPQTRLKARTWVHCGCHTLTHTCTKQSCRNVTTHYVSCFLFDKTQHLRNSDDNEL